MRPNLDLGQLPDLPQRATIEKLAGRIWTDEGVLAERHGFAYSKALRDLVRRA